MRLNYLITSNEFWENHYLMPAPEIEYKFCTTRKWRLDYAWPDVKLAVEKEGGIFKKGKDGKQGGRHNRPLGFKRDMEKYNALESYGWHLLRYEPTKINYDQIAHLYIRLRRLYYALEQIGFTE